MRPDSAERESTRVDNRVAGKAMTKAKVIPAVAIATVRQVSRATSQRKSSPTSGGMKALKKRSVGSRLPSANNTQGRNSVSVSSGQSNNKPSKNQVRRPFQAGSRQAGATVDGAPLTGNS
jgi:hypothetical protein